MEFHSLYSHEFIRIASCVPRARVADPDFAAEETIAMAREGDAAATAVMLFPELGISSYAIDDLLFQDALLDAVETAIARIREASATLFPVLVIGAPLRRAGRLYNAGIVIHRGAILGAVPKTYLPTYREFYESRHFTLRRWGHRAHHHSRGRGAVWHGPAIPFARVPFPSPSMWRSARTCGCRCPRPPARR